MSFFQILFRKKKLGESVILVDIGAEGIAGAYVRYEENQLPTLLYARRLPIEIRKDEAPERAMQRALDILCAELLREGAPTLKRATGSGTATMIIVSIDAPWQETKVRTEVFESREPFTFTKNIVIKRLGETAPASSGQIIADESIISTMLNGYETHSPYGKKAHRASIVVLSSLIERKIANDITSTLRKHFHGANILPISGSSLRYQAMRKLFPHESDAVILDATDESILTVALIRKGIFSSLVQVTISLDADTWTNVITNEFIEIAKNYQLPRTLFLLAREPQMAALKKMLDATDFGSIWLSGNPPKVVPVLASQMGSSIRQATAGSGDIVLLLMALFWKSRDELSEKIV